MPDCEFGDAGSTPARGAREKCLVMRLGRNHTVDVARRVRFPYEAPLPPKGANGVVEESGFPHLPVTQGISRVQIPSIPPIPMGPHSLHPKRLFLTRMAMGDTLRG